MENLGNRRLFGKVPLLMVMLPPDQNAAVDARAITSFSAILQTRKSSNFRLPCVW